MDGLDGWKPKAGENFLAMAWENGGKWGQTGKSGKKHVIGMGRWGQTEETGETGG